MCYCAYTGASTYSYACDVLFCIYKCMFMRLCMCMLVCMWLLVSGASACIRMLLNYEDKSKCTHLCIIEHVYLSYYTWISTFWCVYGYACDCVHLNVHVLVCMWLFIHWCELECLGVNACECTCFGVHVSVHVFVCMWMCMCIHMCQCAPGGLQAQWVGHHHNCTL